MPTGISGKNGTFWASEGPKTPSEGAETGVETGPKMPVVFKTEDKVGVTDGNAKKSRIAVDGGVNASATGAGAAAGAGLGAVAGAGLGAKSNAGVGVDEGVGEGAGEIPTGENGCSRINPSCDSGLTEL